MRDVVIVDAVRTPIGRRNGGLATMHSADLLGVVQSEVLQRSGVDSGEIGQVIAGCPQQVGMQGFNVARVGWLSAGLAPSAAGATLNAACGSSHHATNLAYALIASEVVDSAIACGVENMSRIPMGSSMVRGLGKGVSDSYRARYEAISQFEAAERIAKKWGITRRQVDELGLESQHRLAAAWAEDRFSSQLVPVDAPDHDDEGRPTGTTHRVERDEGLRSTSLDALASLTPTVPDGVHTAGNSSQIADGAGALLMMTREKADALSLRPRARIVATCLVGCDPVLMLTGPIDATHHLLQRTGLTMNDIDLFEINEAFASVVLAWEAECKPDHDRVNPNGGAIAHGHPLGGTGTILLAKAVHELERLDAERALITMCCGGGMATGTIIERI